MSQTFDVDAVGTLTPVRLLTRVLERLKDEKGRVPPELSPIEARAEVVRAGPGGDSSPMSSVDLWPLYRFAQRNNLLNLLSEEGIPAQAFALQQNLTLDSKPLSIDQSLPDVSLMRAPTRLGGYEVDFPLCLPASILSANSDSLKYYAARGFSILTYKTVRSREHVGNKPPHWIFLRTGHRLDAEEPMAMVGEVGFYPDDTGFASMANSFGIPSHGPGVWMEDVARTRSWIRSGQVLIVSVVATQPSNPAELIADYVQTASMAREAGAQIIELNFSCPNTSREYSQQLYQDFKLAAQVSSAVRNSVPGTPIFAKIGYLSELDLRAFVLACGPYLDGVTCINTVSTKIVKENGEPAFGDRGSAGVSGWAIKAAAHEVALKIARIRDDAAESIGKRLDLIGVGGVADQDDFEDRLGTGVDAVGICTGAFLNPHIGLSIRLEKGKDYRPEPTRSIDAPSQEESDMPKRAKPQRKKLEDLTDQDFKEMEERLKDTKKRDQLMADHWKDYEKAWSSNNK